MSKKGYMINRFLEEKENHKFKGLEWVEKKEKLKKVTSKYVKNLK
jgi:hypothetical protein